MTDDTRPRESSALPEPAKPQAGQEPIAGYRLIEPLGKGGFGEVWKCQAPGGFLKAIKFVHGSQLAGGDGHGLFADQERRAIEHIKNIRHPFVLTVERAELCNGTLMIVMELADRSLDDLFWQYHKSGQAGIPRAELLNYLTEAAEALDLMNFQHGLQHLDIKPQNLFLVGGHLKVADFGLVNRLPEHKLGDTAGEKASSVPGGISPRYAAPEQLRRQIGRRCDQYSLAIVYQELLTGELPFKGRTNAQLMVQHLQAMPDLAALPAPDHDVVARALAKDPDERFPSCAEFVAALVRSGARPAVAPTAATAPVSAPRSSASLADISLGGLTYTTLLGHTPLGEVWQVADAAGTTRWAYHLQGFAVEADLQQQQGLAYLQALRHRALLRFKVAELAAHRIILIFDPWGRSLAERCRRGKLEPEDLLRAFMETAHALDELAARFNLGHLCLSPDAIVQGLDGAQLRDFGLVSMLWKTAERPLDTLNPRYAAPELAHGKTGPTADQYSLAAIYADVRTLQLTGKMWPAGTAGSKGRPASVNLASIPVPEREVLRRALDTDPGRRFSNCVELINALAATQGGEVSQATTAIHGALKANQESFLATLNDWIAKQIDAATGGAAADEPGLKHVCLADIVPGTTRLRLEMFEQQAQARCVAATENEFRFFMPLKRGIWDQLLNRSVGVDVRVFLEQVEGGSQLRKRATIFIKPYRCSAAQAREVQEQLAPAVLQNLRACLNAIPERRGGKRVPFQANIMVRHRPSGCPPNEYPAEVFNVSKTGLGLVTSEPLPPGADIRMMLCLPIAGAQPIAILVKAVVRRCRELPERKYEIGAEFLTDRTSTRST